jgi:HAMP domain-containing protein
MLKSLTARAIIPVTVAVTGFVIVCCILLYTILKTDMTNEAIKHATNQASTIVKSTRYAMLHDDRATLLNIIKNVGTQEGLEHVRIFNKKGLIMFASNNEELGRFVDKNTAGCIECHSTPVPSATLGDMKQARRFVNKTGAEVLAITTPVYNEPECFNAACHVHPAGQKILGTLDIGLSASPLLKYLEVMQGRLIIFSIMVLLVTLGGVAALLRRNVFLPIKSLASFTDQAVSGRLDQEIPHSGHDEIEQIAANIRIMAKELKEARRETEKGKRGD